MGLIDPALENYLIIVNVVNFNVAKVLTNFIRMRMKTAPDERNFGK